MFAIALQDSVRNFVNGKSIIFNIRMYGVPSSTKQFSKLLVTQPLVPKSFSGNSITIVAELLLLP